MKLNQLSLSFGSDEVFLALQSAIARATSVNAQIPPELADLTVKLKSNRMILSSKMKLGFMPVTLSLTIALRPTESGEGVVITLDKVSAGIVGSQAIAAQLLGEIGRHLQNVPGCSVSGNDIILTKETLAAKAPWLSVPGKITRFGIENDTLEIAIG